MAPLPHTLHWQTRHAALLTRPSCPRLDLNLVPVRGGAVELPASMAVILMSGRRRRTRERLGGSELDRLSTLSTPPLIPDQQANFRLMGLTDRVAQ